MARLAIEGGDPVLARICGTIAADEKRHENAYTRIIEKLLEVDPNTTMIAIAYMMRKRITMPLHLMYDGQNLNIFKHFSAITQKQGVYTSRDYTEILEFFITRWELEKLEGLTTAEARRAQDFVCRLPRKIRKFENREKILESHPVKFSWIFNKQTISFSQFNIPSIVGASPPPSTTIHRHKTTLSRRLSPVLAVASPTTSPSRHQVTHSMPPEKLEIFKSLEPWVSENVLPLRKPVEKCWQPIEFLPDPSQGPEQFEQEVRALRQRVLELSDEYFVMLVGNMLTEDALPTYQTLFNTFDGVRDETGSSPCPWAIWTRAWSAEENRHGDLLRTYLYLSGRVDMLMVEKTLQYSIGAGIDIGLENNPYLGYVYASFQERATCSSHGNMARLAIKGGDPMLARICGTIAADEKRHEHVYTRIVEKLLEVDPNATMLAIAHMMKKKIIMPMHLIYDGQDPNIFEHFSAIGERQGIYTSRHYAEILEFFITRWKLEKLEGLIGEARRAQDYVCGLPPRVRKLESRAKKIEPRQVKFSWIFNKQVSA
ncbi:hypothetical protein KY290_030098 [Solanum tuberosum]|uniref:Acyl-[acyl-carrier-protein] desaturase n=1 Tax=Solanum tuberosum TaxID=4113 RepID=A0ABQ7UMK9_SOLTU|nr:hypothetical protein KY290_030098 [Solanum tuberosum]